MEVQDTGMGIKPENLPKLFMDFAKLDEHSRVNAEGTGLGLSICKKIVEQMGGKVTVSSQLTKGTCFRVEL
jgi:signal transduction histidine kinase